MGLAGLERVVVRLGGGGGELNETRTRDIMSLFNVSHDTQLTRKLTAKN
jgi:hypothetical protein